MGNWPSVGVHTHGGTPVADDVIYGHLVAGHAMIASSVAPAESMQETHRKDHARGIVATQPWPRPRTSWWQRLVSRLHKATVTQLSKDE